MDFSFYKLIINEIIYDTDESAIIKFHIPAPYKSKFNFNPGQNITIRNVINGHEVRRSYSICSAPFENKLQIGIKLLSGGLFSTFALSHLKPGDEIEVMPPSGSFTPKSNQGNFIFIAAGSGITPIMSMIKHLIHHKEANHISLIYGNRNTNSIMFKDEIEGLKSKNMDLFHVVHILSQDLNENSNFSGRIDKSKLEFLLNNLLPSNIQSQFFICGPQEMTQIIKNTLIFDHHFNESQIHFELFYAGEVSHQRKIQTPAKADLISKMTLKLHGKESIISIPYYGQSVLEIATEYGLDLPFSCKNGVCNTCKAKIIKGKVKMDKNFALEPDELEDGYILTCQSHPITDEIYIDFDY